MDLPLALPHMQKQKNGHIINITSVFGIKVFAPAGTVYCATKAAGRALTEGLRMELHSQNIRCTMISPGAVASARGPRFAERVGATPANWVAARVRRAPQLLETTRLSIEEVTMHSDSTKSIPSINQAANRRSGYPRVSWRFAASQGWSQHWRPR
jgi:NAD(P)-dependent dehydrogenase (short-subunit alcohol dehydrogenase family)